MKLNKTWCSIAAILINQCFSTGAMAMDQDAIIRRLDALERENNALKQRLNKVEHTTPRAKNIAAQQSYDKDVTSQRSGKTVNVANIDPALDVPSALQVASNTFAQENPNTSAYIKRHFELSGSLLVLQPGTDNPVYGTRVSPFPTPTPNWNDQAIQSNYKPTFNIGFRYMPNEYNDVDVNWTHLNTATTNSYTVNPLTQMTGPSYYIGPQAANYGMGKGDATFAYDAVRIEGGHTFCPECTFNFRPFGGVEFASINNSQTGTFSNAAGAQIHNGGLNLTSNTVSSNFVGIGPRAGLNTTYNWNDVQLISKFGGGLLIGTQHNNFQSMTTCSDGCTGAGITNPQSIALVGNYQTWTQPSSTKVMPTIDTKLAAAYSFAPTSYGQFKIEAGYQAALYFNANTQYELSNVIPAANISAPSGIYLATGSHTQNNFFVQGPYVSGKWAY
jgi:hypothetical protein